MVTEAKRNRVTDREKITKRGLDNDTRGESYLKKEMACSLAPSRGKNVRCWSRRNPLLFRRLQFTKTASSPPEKRWAPSSEKVRQATGWACQWSTVKLGRGGRDFQTAPLIGSPWDAVRALPIKRFTSCQIRISPEECPVAIVPVHARVE